MIQSQALRASGVILLCVIMSGCVPRDTGWSALYDRDAGAPLDVVIPARAPSISQQFNYARFSSGDRRNHNGIDIVDRPGSSIIAAASGRVVESYAEPAFGNRITIDHGLDGRGIRSQTVYKHLATRLVSKGEFVSRGEQIGTMGRTGTLAGGLVHLHFELHRASNRYGMQPVDPHQFWLAGPGRVTCFGKTGHAARPEFRISYPAACRGDEPAAQQSSMNGGSLADLRRSES